MAELVITAVATDPHGQTATASVTVDVLDPAPATAARFSWFGPPPAV
jgi:hypothetical protein